VFDKLIILGRNWLVFCLLLCFELELDNASSFFIKFVILVFQNIP